MEPFVPKSFFGRMFSSDDRTADSIAFVGFMIGVTLCAAELWDVIINKREFAPFTFGGGATAVLGGIGGGKKLRDMATGGTAPQPPLPEGTKP
jgi:hypothetical protein